MIDLKDQGLLPLGGLELEYRMIGPRPGEAPTIVLLHEGLGCVGMWRDFPDALAEATGRGVFVYSRQGYGRSSPCALPRPLTYMHHEGQEVLPRLLESIGFQRGTLFGHSDGGATLKTRSIPNSLMKSHRADEAQNSSCGSATFRASRSFSRAARRRSASNSFTLHRPHRNVVWNTIRSNRRRRMYPGIRRAAMFR